MAFLVESRDYTAQSNRKLKLIKRLSKGWHSTADDAASIEESSADSSPATIINIQSDFDSNERRRNTAEALREAMNYLKMQEVLSQLLQLYRRINRLWESIERPEDAEEEAGYGRIEKMEEIYALEDRFYQMLEECAAEFLDDFPKEEVHNSCMSQLELMAESDFQVDLHELNQQRFSSYGADQDLVPDVISEEDTALLLDTLNSMMEVEAQTLAAKIKNRQNSGGSGEEERIGLPGQAEEVAYNVSQRILSDSVMAMAAIDIKLDPASIIKLLAWPLESR